MAISDFRPLIKVILLAVAAFILHKIALFYVIDEAGFLRSTEITYLIFLGFSICIVAILIKVRSSNIDYVGQAFLLLTCIKMAGAYLLLRPILKLGEAGWTEKINFIIVFAIFLTIETIVTVGILNAKPRDSKEA